jgi:hypothetical protein
VTERHEYVRDGTEYTIKSETLVTVENNVTRDQNTAVRINTGSVDLATKIFFSD